VRRLSRALVVVTLGAAFGAAWWPRADARAEGGAKAGGSHFQAPGGLDPVAANAACARCHADVAQEHEGSRHRQAFTEPAFQRALALEPFPFCRSCHAPEADPLAAPSAALGALGVACTSCHGDASAPRAVRASTRSPHPLTVDASFGTDAACARCHEFLFPDSARRVRPQLFQRTVQEHQASPDRATPCAGCHLPATGERRSHAFAASRDPSALRRAVAITAERRADPGFPGRIVVTLTPQGVGHAFPTGDLFRRVLVQAESVGPEHASLGESSTTLARSFRDVPRGLGVVRTEVADTRLVAGETRAISLDLGPTGASHPIDVRVSYQRVQNGGPHATATVGSEVLLFSARLAPP
jgi:hypothetical protein